MMPAAGGDLGAAATSEAAASPVGVAVAAAGARATAAGRAGVPPDLC